MENKLSKGRINDFYHMRPAGYSLPKIFENEIDRESIDAADIN